MQNLTPGMTALILNGPFAGYSGLIKSVSETAIITEIELYGRKTPITLTPKDVRALDQISSWQEEPASERPFRVGDTVFIHEAIYDLPDQIGSVIAVLSDPQQCVVSLDEGGKQHTRAYAF